MKTGSYFTLYEWVIIISAAMISVLVNIYLPMRIIVQSLGVPGPAAGMALFGGLIFVFWISLACQIIKKRYSGIITSLFIGSFCLFFRPWYGIVSPPWFSIYGIVGLVCMGVVIEVMRFKRSGLSILGGGLGNLACLMITWLAIGVHTSIWMPQNFVLLIIFGAVMSGSIGAFLARGIARVIAH